MSKASLHLQKEGLFLVAIGVIIYLLIARLIPFLSFKYLAYLAGGLFLIIQYSRVVLFERRIIWTRTFWVKLVFGLLNIPLFFFVITWMMNWNAQIEDYSYNVGKLYTSDIKEGLPMQSYLYLRSLTVFVNIGLLVMIVLFELRMVYSVFKYREGPKFLELDR